MKFVTTRRVQQGGNTRGLMNTTSENDTNDYYCQKCKAEYMRLFRQAREEAYL